MIMTPGSHLMLLIALCGALLAPHSAHALDLAGVGRVNVPVTSLKDIKFHRKMGIEYDLS